jgi:hypothetical protein
VKRFFFEKKPGRPRSKKLSVLGGVATGLPRPAVNESFFAARRPGSFFSKKEALACLIFAYCWRRKKGRGCRLSPA